ncbi:hypothetical protein EUGRSUZ_L00822 [Eucalyptus grandis]|uniref:Phytocyanin domain-containing protein n=2 Tax=Eucalyptus grandis TaxID=71139 RepID=A0AAD9TCB9_EUCGR|nr:hypothetical protein EUGRSUZ_L00822 [Eucalyptus grandis]
MAMKFGRAMVLVVIASVMMGASLAYPGWNNNNGYAWPPKQDMVPPRSLRRMFKYDPPSDSNTHPHSVYMFPSFWSYMRCDLKRATMVANVSDGAGDGFEFKLSQKWKFYFFACGESGGFHCSTGKMRFSVVSLPRPWKWHG